MDTRYIVTCARGLAGVLLEELKSLGVDAEEPDGDITRASAVYFSGDRRAAYRVVLWSRVASRVIRVLSDFPVYSEEDVYGGSQRIGWDEHISVSTTFAISVTVAGKLPSEGMKPPFLGLRAKDGLVDRMREDTGERPNVDTESPDLRINLRIEGDETVGLRGIIGVDISGPMHRRGYRDPSAPAPLRETLAAGVLLLAGYDGSQPLYDPMCGSGTLVMEAAMISANIAPGLLRGRLPYPAFYKKLYDELQEEARESRRDIEHPIIARDIEPEMVTLTKRAAKALNVTIDVKVADALEGQAPVAEPGLVVCNPPYGERLGAHSHLADLYGQFGDRLKQQFSGWNAFLLCADSDLAKSVGLRAKRRTPLFNGPIECRLLHFPLQGTVSGEAPKWRKRTAESEMFENRLKKNLKKLKGWAKSANITCYRLYDRDIPEFNVAVDVYGDELLVQEFAAPHSIDAQVAARRLSDALTIVKDLVPDVEVHVRVRRRQSQRAQYQKLTDSGVRKVVHEGKRKYLVNLTDYLDSGVFLDVRGIRNAIYRSRPKRFLNLFAYTCTASIAAAQAGAKTTSVDLSKRYLDWGRDNFEENDLSLSGHHFVRADVVRWKPSPGQKFDSILLAPPSYSRSKAMSDEFEIQRDHARIIRNALSWLSPSGTLYFSSHGRGFTLDSSLKSEAKVTEITKSLKQKDFARLSHKTFTFSV